MKYKIELIEANSQSHSAECGQKWPQQPTQNDPIKAGILVFLILFFVLAAIGFFIGGIHTVPLNPTVAGVLFATSGGVLKMMYGVVRMLFGYPPATIIVQPDPASKFGIKSSEE